MVAAAPAAADDQALPGDVVLLIGRGLWPDEALAAQLRRDGLRGLALARPEQVSSMLRAAHVVAVVLEAEALGGLNKVGLATLRGDWPCPVLLVAPVADELAEILALETGADAVLVRPLAPRRLLAHLRALLRLARICPAQPRRELGLDMA